MGFWTLSIVRKSKILDNTTFRKLDLLPSSGEGGGETPTVLGPLDRANLNHWNESWLDSRLRQEICLQMGCGAIQPSTQ
jgi:hypothetical protein